eukprot:362877-Chlamydomonas_euryale.AAC.3
MGRSGSEGAVSRAGGRQTERRPSRRLSAANAPGKMKNMAMKKEKMTGMPIERMLYHDGFMLLKHFWLTDRGASLRV